MVFLADMRPVKIADLIITIEGDQQVPVSKR
jgi:hypothetical protein